MPRIRKRDGAGLWACILGLLVADSAFGQTELRWRLKAGERLQLALSQSSSTEAEIAGRTYTSSLKIAATLDWHVIAIDEGGAATVDQTLTQLNVAAELPGAAPIRYESASQEKPTGAAKVVADEFRPILGKPARMKLLPTGEIKETAEPRLADGADHHPRPPFTAKDIRQLLGRLVPALPPEPVLPDDSWGACQEQATPEGKIAIAAQFVSRGTEMRTGAPMEKIEANYVFSAEKEKEKEVALEFTDQENRGVFHFDAAAGRLMRGEIRQSMTLRLRVEESEVSQKAKGAMTIEIRPQAGQGTR